MDKIKNNYMCQHVEVTLTEYKLKENDLGCWDMSCVNLKKFTYTRVMQSLKNVTEEEGRGEGGD